MLLLIILFHISYIDEGSIVNFRLSQIEGQTWMKSLDYLSDLSASDDNRITPFTFRISEVKYPLVNFTFFLFNDEFETLLTME